MGVHQTTEEAFVSCAASCSCKCREAHRGDGAVAWTREDRIRGNGKMLNVNLSARNDGKENLRSLNSGEEKYSGINYYFCLVLKPKLQMKIRIYAKCNCMISSVCNYYYFFYPSTLLNLHTLSAHVIWFPWIILCLSSFV